MNPMIFFEGLATVGGLTGLATLLVAVAGFHKSKTSAAELTPNHGSSVSDKIGRIEAQGAATTAKIDGLAKVVESSAELTRAIGHQIGELNRAKISDHDDIRDRLGRLENR